MSRHIKVISVLAIGIALAVFAQSARAGTLTFSDQNSSVSITPSTSFSSSSGMTNWTVNGQNIAGQQWFWYAPNNNTQTSLDTLGLTGSGYILVGSSTRGAYATYSGTGLSVEVDYLLTGGSMGAGGSAGGQSDLSETIRLTNTGGTNTSQTFRFYQYSDFNLSPGSASTDKVMFPNATTVTQFNATNTTSMQTVATPAPSDWEALGVSGGSSTLAGLTGSSTYTLQDTPALGASAAGPNVGGTSWAYEWVTPAIQGGGTYIISNDEQVNPGSLLVPEPSTCAILFAAGGAAAAARFWRRRRARS